MTTIFKILRSRIMEYNYPEHYAESAWEAIELAEYLKKSGKYDLFRGQRQNYDIQPSALRSGVNPQTVEKKLNEFANWVHRTPDLKSLHGNENALIAVAQHYGLKTTFLDFSRSPKIAGFFATDGGKSGDTGTLICVNKQRFNESWEDINRSYFEDEGRLLTEIIDIDVNNLWRLHAQQGEFLRCNVDSNVLEMFSFFLHIHFPQESRTKVLPKEKIYPIEKSHLEVLLDQYFLIDSYPERFKKMEEMFQASITVSEESLKSEVMGYFSAKKIPENHESWSQLMAKQWMVEPKENYLEQKVVESAQLIVPTISDMSSLETTIEGQLANIIEYCEPTARPNIKWSVVNEAGNELFFTGEGVTADRTNEFVEFSVAEMVNSIYAGMRYLPYNAKQITRVIVRYFIMLFFSPYDVIEDCEGVEFSGGEVRGRGFASRSRIIGALRSDFFQRINSRKLDSKGKMEFRDTLFAARFVRSSYSFEGFIELFVEDLIPTQAALAIEKLVIGVNPLRIDVLGES
jgi:FRG domain